MKSNKSVVLEDGRSWWLRLAPGDLAPNVLMAIELDMPKRCLLPLLTDVKQITDFGEYQVYTGKYQDVPVSLVYHGTGAFSVSTALEEIAVLGAEKVVRVGSCGGISGSVAVGDLVVCEGTIRDDKLMLDYVPAEYPAVADFEMVGNALDACREQHIPAISGISLSTATLYPGSGYETAVGILAQEPYERVKLWEKLNALVVDIETSTVLIMSRIFNMKGASVLGVSNHCITGEGGYLTDEWVTSVARTGLEALTRTC